MNKLCLFFTAMCASFPLAQAAPNPLPDGITMNTPLIEAAARLNAVSFDSAQTNFQAYKRVNHKTGEVFAVSFRGHGSKNIVYSQDYHNPLCYIESFYFMWHTPEMPLEPVLAMFNIEGKPLTNANWPVQGNNGVDTQYWARNLTLRDGVKFRVVKVGESKDSPIHACKSWKEAIVDNSLGKCLEEGPYLSRAGNSVVIPVRPMAPEGEKFVSTALHCSKTGPAGDPTITVGDVLTAPDQVIHLEF